MGRNMIDIDEQELINMLAELPTQQAVADHFGVSQPTISNRIKELGLVKSRGTTNKDSRIEFPSLSWEEVKKILFEVQNNNSPTVGYEAVDIEIESPGNILIIPLLDLHIGSRYTYSRELVDLIDLIVENPRVFTGFNGDLADNYNTSAYRGGQIEQGLKIQMQKAIVETLVKRLHGNILWFINGCHDEWSYFNDGFDFAQYLSHKDVEGYYMGHHGTVKLYLNGIKYKLFVTHNTYRNSTLNEPHGLKWVCREHVGYDAAIKGHDHVPFVDEFILRNRIRYAICGAPWKGQDRHGSKVGYSPIIQTTPGIIFNGKEKAFLADIDYKNLVKYL